MFEETVNDRRCADAGGGRHAVRGHRSAMARLFVLLLVAAGLSALVPAMAAAGKWQRQSYAESPIRLRLDWPWLAGEKGSFAQAWNARYSGHLFYGSWVQERSRRLEVLVDRLAPMHYWKHMPKIRKSHLENWKFLDKTGLEKVRDVGCGRGSCLAFEAGYYSCVGFLFAAGPLGSPNDGGAEEGGDMVSGYYCVDPDVGSAASDLDRILDAIVLVED